MHLCSVASCAHDDASTSSTGTALEMASVEHSLKDGAHRPVPRMSPKRRPMKQVTWGQSYDAVDRCISSISRQNQATKQPLQATTWSRLLDYTSCGTLHHVFVYPLAKARFRAGHTCFKAGPCQGPLCLNRKAALNRQSTGASYENSSSSAHIAPRILLSIYLHIAVVHTSCRGACKQLGFPRQVPSVPCSTNVRTPRLPALLNKT